MLIFKRLALLASLLGAGFLVVSVCLGLTELDPPNGKITMKAGVLITTTTLDQRFGRVEEIRVQPVTTVTLRILTKPGDWIGVPSTVIRGGSATTLITPYTGNFYITGRYDIIMSRAFNLSASDEDIRVRIIRETYN